MFVSILILLFIFGSTCAFQLQCHTPVATKLYAFASSIGKEEEESLPSSPYGIIFDMDGTLIQHSIDFANLRRRIYQTCDEDRIGKHLNLRDDFFVVAAQLSPEGQKKCKEIFIEIEQKSLDDMLLAYGGVELLKYLQDNDIKRAVLTRNREKNVYHMRDLYLREMKKSLEVEEEELFDTIVARDTKAHESATEPLKSKPDPAGILHICKVWGCDPKEVLMVGDNKNDDIMAANRAGCGSVLVTQEGGVVLDTCSGYSVGDTEEEILLRTPSLKVESLLELKNHLEENANKRSGEIDKKLGTTFKPQTALAHSTDTFSVEVPSISVK